MFLSIRTLAPIALSLALVSLTSCQSASKEGKTTFSHTIDSTDIKHVEVATVSVQTLPDLQEYTSTVEAKVTNQIAPQMASRIKRIYVEVGQQVSRGQLLAEMDHSQLEQARLQLEERKSALARIDELYKIGGISQSEWEATRRALTLAQTSYNNIKENTQLRSPISGVVTARNYDAGDMMSPQMPLLVVEQVNPVVLRVNPSERYYGQMTKGMPVTITSESLPDETFAGKISLKYPTINPQTHTFTMEVEATNPERKLVPGQYARVSINLGDKEYTVVPTESIVKQIGSAEQCVYIVRDGIAHRQVVLVERTVGKYTAISEGVSSGDVVVTTGASILSDQMPVQISQAQQ